MLNACVTPGCYKRYGLALRNEEELGRWRNAAHEYLKEAEELAKQQVAEAYGRDMLVFCV
jgi:hypothetical protein